MSSVLLFSLPNPICLPPTRTLITASEDISQEEMVVPTKQVVPGQGVEDPWGSDEVAHGSGQSGGINPDGDKRVPDVDVSQKAVIPLKQDTVKIWRTRFKRLL